MFSQPKRRKKNKKRKSSVFHNKLQRMPEAVISDKSHQSDEGGYKMRLQDLNQMLVEEGYIEIEPELTAQEIIDDIL